MLATFSNIRRANVNDRASDTTSRSDDDVVVLGNLEGIERLVGGLIENTSIDGIGNGIVYELAKDETVTTLVEDLHRFGRDR